MTATAKRKEFDLDYLLHPAGAFRTPMGVVSDPDMTVQEKRAILEEQTFERCDRTSSVRQCRSGSARARWRQAKACGPDRCATLGAATYLVYTWYVTTASTIRRRQDHEHR